MGLAGLFPVAWFGGVPPRQLGMLLGVWFVARALGVAGKMVEAVGLAVIAEIVSYAALAGLLWQVLAQMG